MANSSNARLYVVRHPYAVGVFFPGLEDVLRARQGAIRGRDVVSVTRERLASALESFEDRPRLSEAAQPRSAILYVAYPPASRLGEQVPADALTLAKESGLDVIILLLRLGDRASAATVPHELEDTVVQLAFHERGLVEEHVLTRGGLARLRDSLR